MEFSHFFIMFSVLLASWLICLTSAKPSSAASQYPAFESFDDSDNENYLLPYAKPITDFHLSRLRRGYYYVDRGYITAIPASALLAGKRLDSEITKSAEEREDRYTPLLRIKQQQTKRKKLFVPNLYG